MKPRAGGIASSSRALVGVHVLASEAGERHGAAALAVPLRAPVDESAHTFHPYRTNAEAFKVAYQPFTTNVPKLACCA